MPRSITHGDVFLAYFNKIWGIPSHGTYTTLTNIPINVPTGNLSVSGINEPGHIVGWFLNSNLQTTVSFNYNNGRTTFLSDPTHNVAAHGTFANDINDEGQIVGYTEDSSDVAHGFLYDGGTYTTIDDPLATAGTFLTGINENPEIVGYYRVGNQEHGFLYSHGLFTTIDHGSDPTELTGINDSGDIVGNYFDSAGHSHGFVASPHQLEAFSDDTARIASRASGRGACPPKQ